MAHVLIVDDEPDGCEAVAAYLRRVGHDVRYAPGGRAAVWAILEEVPDAILLDLLMPDMDGFAVLETVRAYLRWYTVPVAVFTAYPEDPRLWHVDGHGVTKVFVKSRVSLPQVLQWVNEQAGRAHRAPAGVAHPYARRERGTSAVDRTEH
jgi:CheY-like chemotaxis protein